ncbi:MAG: PQQ-like beta-propeller repeat protein [Gemmataceae bacterium]|nr:PQQ-like beta-propeller repeat protein [Gemmataceae bacterium]
MRPFMAAALVVATSLPAGADDWPRWRGPNADGVSRETGLLPKWPAAGPPLDWKTDAVGHGYAGLSVVGDRVYTLGLFGEDEHALALDAGTGKVVWSVPVGPRFENPWGDGPRSTPTADGPDLFVLAARGRLSCLDRATGKARWAVELGGVLMKGNIIDTNWGHCASPAVVDGVVVVCPGGGPGTVAGLDRKTGAERWRTKDLAHAAAYGSPVPAVFDGEAQCVVVTGGVEGASGLVTAGGRPVVAGVRASDGAVRWTAPAPYKTGPIIPTPVVAGDRVFATAGYGAGAACYQVERDGDGYRAKLVYKTKEMTNYYGEVVLKDGLLYGYTDPTGWKCVDFRTGEGKWEQYTSASAGAVVAADGRLYVVATDAKVRLAALTGDDWAPLGEFALPGVSKYRAARHRVRVATPPVVANGRLYAYRVKAD